MVLLPIDDEHAPIYAVGQVADMLRVQPAYLRRLDVEQPAYLRRLDVEQVVQPSRSKGGQRRYSRAEIGLVRRVTDMADEGMTLVGIRRILELEQEVRDLQAQLEAARARPRP